MKIRNRLLALLLAAALVLVGVSAAGGDAGDPLVSLSYLETVFAPAAERSAQERIDAAGAAVYGSAAAKWRAAVDAVDAAGGAAGTREPSAPARWEEKLLKQSDALSASTGTQLTVLTGSLHAQFSSGAVVDVTEGTELASGAALQPRHRYLIAEDTVAAFIVDTRTAVVDCCGGSLLTPSAHVPDYNAMASALKTLTLFRGTTTGYGQGFDLDLTPTRIQALVMLIRMLGEESAALACAANVPFRDIPASYWGRPYVAYAFEKGYTNGVEDNLFAPDRPANAGMYVEFVLRALGYSDTTQTNVSTAAARAYAAGVLTAGECAALRENDFLRADVVYLSWYALDTALPDGVLTLHEKLEAVGVFTRAAYENAKRLVATPRL